MLKPRKPDLRIVAVEPEESPVLSGGQHSPHKIQGIGAGFVPDVLDRSVIDEIVKVNSATALETSRALARMKGIPGGISSGAAIAAALEIGKRPESCGQDHSWPSCRRSRSAIFRPCCSKESDARKSRWPTSRDVREP